MPLQRLFRLTVSTQRSSKVRAAFALGCPAMGDEVLEEGTMESIVAEVEKFASGKKIALFGPTDGETVSGCGTGLTR